MISDKTEVFSNCLVLASLYMHLLCDRCHLYQAHNGCKEKYLLTRCSQNYVHLRLRYKRCYESHTC